MLAPLVNQEVLGECIFGIEHNAKYAGATGESGSTRECIFGIVPTAKYAFP